MTKQKEIREGVETLLCGLYNVHLDGNKYADRILNFLNEVGVVLKVDKELPGFGSCDTHQLSVNAEGPQHDCVLCREMVGRVRERKLMIESGFEAVEPLL